MPVLKLGRSALNNETVDEEQSRIIRPLYTNFNPENSARYKAIGGGGGDLIVIRSSKKRD